MSSFNKSVKEIHNTLENGDQISVQTVDFVDKKIIYVKYNGEIDSTFDVQAPDSKSLYDIISNSTNSSDFSCEKTCLLGDNSNIKLSVIVNHIAKLVYTSNETRGLIISVSSKIFKSKESDKEDFDRLLLVLDLIKRCNESQ